MKISGWLLFFWFNFAIFSSTSFSKIESLQDIKNYGKEELAQIKHRYSEYKKNPHLFSEETFTIIDQSNLAPILGHLLLHKHIKLNLDQMVDFAQEINDAGLEFTRIEPRINRYIANNYLPFSALRKAIQREQFHLWKINKNNQVREENGPFINYISSLNLTNADKNKVINAFAVCINPYRFDHERVLIRPSVCEPVDNYKAPRCHQKPVFVREKPASHQTPHVMAYRELITQAREVAINEGLDTFEKVKMAKCIAEQSLRFFIPTHHLFKSLQKLHAMDKKSPEETFFMRTGICGNFSGIAYNIAKELGLDGTIYLTKKGWHIYLEFRENMCWYHTHAFNRESSCDIIKFKGNHALHEEKLHQDVRLKSRLRA